MNKILGLLLIFLLITNCSLDKKSGLWSENSKIDIEKDLIITELFEDEKTFSKEFNSNVKIKLKSNLTNNNFTNNLSNNNGRVNYNGSLKIFQDINFHPLTTLINSSLKLFLIIIMLFFLIIRVQY